MKKVFLLLSAVLFTVALSAQTSFHGFKVTDIDGREFDMASLKGKKVLVVNVASKCGLTPQYADLQKLYERYADRGFVIVGFPSNNFLEQEPGTNAEIKEFCERNYGVTFPIMSKIEVVGDGKAPIYRWLTEKALNGKQDAPVTWNFQKFMIDEQGNWAGVADPRTEPLSDTIVRWIEG